MRIDSQAANVKLILFDVDGVLTDGKIVLHADGTESKQFDIRDGIVMVWAQRVGLTIGFLSARSSPVTTQRAAQLGIALVHNGVPVSKLETYEAILRERGLDDGEVAYMGDDILDLPVLGRAGLSAAPADAVEDVRSRVDWVARHNGGYGAARELVEFVLRAQGKWDALVASFLPIEEAGQASPGSGPRRGTP